MSIRVILKGLHQKPVSMSSWPDLRRSTGMAKLGLNNHRVYPTYKYSYSFRHGLIIGMGVRASPQLTPYLEEIIETTHVSNGSQQQGV